MAGSIGAWSEIPAASGRCCLVSSSMMASPYVGKVDSGSNQKTIREITNAMTTRSDSPFRESISEPDVRFCEPVLRVPIEFADFTDDGLLRRPSFSRFVLF